MLENIQQDLEKLDQEEKVKLMEIIRQSIVDSDKEENALRKTMGLAAKNR